MALFESYERRIDKINEVLNSYGIASLEEAEKITKGCRTGRIQPDQKAFSRSVLKMHAGHITVGAAITQSKGMYKSSRRSSSNRRGTSGILYSGFCSRSGVK